MTAVRSVAAVAAVLVAGAGRAQEARVFHTASLQRFDEQLVRDEHMGKPVPAVKRLSDLVERLGGADPKFGTPVFQHGRSARGEVLIAQGTSEQLAAAGRVFDQLKRPETVRARLQCSLVTMPVAVAREHGLKPGEVVATDEPAASRIVRDAVKRSGSLRNLPEVVAGPLAPFARDTGENAGDKAGPEVREQAVEQTSRNRAEKKGDRTAKPPPRLRLRGEMVPMGDGEVVLGVHVVGGTLPHDPTQVPGGALMQPVIRLGAGKSALFMVVDRDVATVLVVRCLDVTTEELGDPVR